MSSLKKIQGFPKFPFEVDHMILLKFKVMKTPGLRINEA